MPAEKYVDMDAETFRSNFLLIPTRLIGSKHPCKIIIDKCVCGEKSGDYNRDEISIEVTKMICIEKEFQIEVSHHEALCMLGLLLHVTVTLVKLSIIPCSLLKKKWKLFSSVIRTKPP